MINDLNMWNKCGRVIANIAKERNIDILSAVDIFYRSEINKQLHNPETCLYLMGDRYFANI